MCSILWQRKDIHFYILSFHTALILASEVITIMIAIRKPRGTQIIELVFVSCFCDLN